MQDAGWLRFHTTGTDDSDFKGAAENGVGRDGFVRRGLNPTLGMKQKSEAWGTRKFDCVRLDDAEGWGSRRYEEKAPRFCDRGAFCWRRPPCGERLGVND
jgi:hypothetical protein